MIRSVPAIGVYPRVAAHIYHTQWDAVSNSELTKLHRSPAHLKAYREQPAQDSVALRIGSAAHASILEPDLFDKEFTVAAQCTATKKGDGQRCANGGVIEHAQLGWLCGVHLKGAPASEGSTRTALSADDHAVCIGVRNAVRSHPGASALLDTAGSPEMSIVWDDTESGVRCRSRIDYYAPLVADGAEPTIVDLKTTRDASPRAFAKSIVEHGYHRQAAMYMHGLAALGQPAKHFVFVAVEKEPPFAVGVYRLADDAIAFGREQLRFLLRRYLWCVEHDEWPAYSDHVVDLTLPNWAWQIDDNQLNEALAEAAA